MGGRSMWSVALAVTAVIAMVSPANSLGPCWVPPVTGRVTDPFREPACVWCPGNRGIEYAVGDDSVVRSVAAGIVTFSGEVAGERFVVVELTSGWKVTYGRVASTTLSVGDVVVAGSAIARTSTSFLFGLRIDDVYTDPAPYLGVESGRRRLIPTDGRPPRRAPPPTLRCAAER